MGYNYRVNKKSYHIYLRIAEFYIQVTLNKIDWVYGQRYFDSHIRTYFKGFVQETKPKNIDATILFDSFEKPGNILKKKNTSKYVELFSRNNSIYRTNYGISIFHFQLILREILENLLIKNDGLLLHASASFIQKQVFIFLGPSEAGKSTIHTLLSKKYRSLADDSIILRKQKDNYIVYQTPFQEKTTWIQKDSNPYPLGKICILQKAHHNYLRSISNRNQLTKIVIEQLWMDVKRSKKSIRTVTEFLLSYKNFFRLGFMNNHEIVSFFNHSD